MRALSCAARLSPSSSPMLCRSPSSPVPASGGCWLVAAPGPLPPSSFSCLPAASAWSDWRGAS
eukprot:3977019-Lingulodinium_polyedra.AAC.1